MLEDLKGLEAGRDITPDKPRWLKYLMDIEKRVYSLLGGNLVYQKDGSDGCSADAVDGIDDLTQKDLEDFIELQHMFRHINPKLSYNRWRGEISGCMLNRLMKGGQFCINGRNNFFPQLFYGAKIEGDMIVDSFRGGALVSYMDISSDCLVMANCTGAELIRCNTYPSDTHTAIFANCKTDMLMYAPFDENKPRIKYLILTNSEFDDIQNLFGTYKNLIAVGCTMKHYGTEELGQSYNAFVLQDGKRLSEEDMIQMNRLGHAMKGKDGKEVYALGKQMIKILEGEKRC